VEDIFLAFEVEIDGAVGDSGFACDVGNFGIEVTIVREDTSGGAEDGLAFIATGHADTVVVKSSGGTHS
jgi:hypothetical protein